MVTDGYSTYTGDHFIMHTNVESLHYTFDNNIVLYNNHILINKK